MGRRWLAVVLAIVGCTRAHDDTVRDEPIAAPASPAPADPAPPAAVDAEPVPSPEPGTPAPVAPTDVAPADSKPPPGDTPLPPGPIPAFAIVIEGATIVAPIDARIEPIRADGIWVLDDAVTPAKIRSRVDELACPERPTTPDDEEESDCVSSNVYPVALVGGVLFFHGDRHNGCEGLNSYDVFATAEPMVDAPADLATLRLRLDGCHENDSTGGPSPPWPLPDADCDGAALERRDDCGSCSDMLVEAEVYTQHRGRLYRVEDEMDPVGTGPRRWSSAALTPKTCPTRADPCGTKGKRFAELDDADDFWIASDGSHALRLDGDAISIVGGAAPVPRGSIGVGEILGARHHADARALIEAMRVPSTASCAALAPEDADFVDRRGGRDWGDRCVRHLRAGRLPEAKAACEAGLAIATKPGTRGAILYNLGLVARKQGDDATARLRFQESLEVRPGNAAVAKALAELDAR